MHQESEWQLSTPLVFPWPPLLCHRLMSSSQEDGGTASNCYTSCRHTLCSPCSVREQPGTIPCFHWQKGWGWLPPPPQGLAGFHWQGLPFQRRPWSGSSSHHCLWCHHPTHNKDRAWSQTWHVWEEYIIERSTCLSTTGGFRQHKCLVWVHKPPEISHVGGQVWGGSCTGGRSVDPLGLAWCYCRGSAGTAGWSENTWNNTVSYPLLTVNCGITWYTEDARRLPWCIDSGSV